MIDFQKLIEHVLLEQDQQPTENLSVDKQEENKTPDQIADSTAKSISEFLKEKHSDLKTKFSDVFKDYFDSQVGIFPDITTFEKLIYTVTKNSIRDTENIGSFENDIASVFPLVDLIALSKQGYTDAGAKQKQAALQTTYNSFLTRLDEFKKTNQKMPLEFPSISPWASSVRNRYHEKQGKVDVGQIKLENSELQNKSIRDAVMVLLEHRRKSKIKLFKKEIAIGSAANDINKILENPDNYIQGSISFPDKKINLLYAGVAPDLILNVAKNAQLLFVQQTKEKELTKEEITPELYKNLLDNNAKDQFNPQRRKVLSNIKQSEQARQSSNYRKVGESFEKALFCVLEQISDKSFLAGTYTIKDIQNYSKAVPQAQQLYNSLKALADHIRTEAEQIDWSKMASGAAQLAKGISSLGGPEMGK